MSTWSLPWRSLGRRPVRPARAAESAATEEPTPWTTAALLNRETSSAEEAAWRGWQQIPLSLKLDDELCVPVVLNDHNASTIVEVTQRLREHREQEKSSLPPVYNFGGDAWEF